MKTTTQSPTNQNAKTDLNDAIVRVIEFLKARQIRLTIAESCTAGEVCSLIANVSGCGSVLYSGYVVYDEQAKRECLDVSAKTIKQFGLTSEEVASEMAKGALNRHVSGDERPNFALAITGTAESDNEEDGVVCFAYAQRQDSQIQVISETQKFLGPRNQVRSQAAHHALLKLPQIHRVLNAT